MLIKEIAVERDKRNREKKKKTKRKRECKKKERKDILIIIKKMFENTINIPSQQYLWKYI